MVYPEPEKWGQTVSDLRRLSVEAKHARSRERFLALYMVASKQTNAASWSKEIGRTDETVLGWIHKYNRGGPEAVYYQRTGGHSPFLPQRKQRNSSLRSKSASQSSMACLDTTGR